MSPATIDCTYWDSVIAKHDVEGSDDTQARNIFVAVGFEMWLVWSSIIIELNYGANDGSNAYNTLAGKDYIPNYNWDGPSSFKQSAIHADGKCSLHT
jgi:hypothetical protein